jgi:hypothetical protein
MFVSEGGKINFFILPIYKLNIFNERTLREKIHYSFIKKAI